jgi:hypothetical protein
MPFTMKSWISFVALLLVNMGAANAQRANTKALGTAASPPATLKDVEWIAGHWRGEAFGGITEEIWSPPLGGSMMCSFKLVTDNKVSFYEMVAMSEEAGSLIIRLKHFHGSMKGWEEKDKTIDFPLVKIEGNRAYFDGMTFERVNPDELHVYVMIGMEGEAKEVLFKYLRVKK